MSTLTHLFSTLQSQFKEAIIEASIQQNEITLEAKKEHLHQLCKHLRDEPSFSFEMLIDLFGVDYKDYGSTEWTTEAATYRGFERGVSDKEESTSLQWKKPRFATTYHLLSFKHNQRIRIRTFAEQPLPIIDSVVDIWPSANWYERETFDLYGIQFTGHPNLQRLLTDYDFQGHPFRKDFPLIGEKEVRYDAKTAKVIYEPITSVTPRTVIPKVIRSISALEDEQPSDHMLPT